MARKETISFIYYTKEKCSFLFHPCPKQGIKVVFRRVCFIPKYAQILLNSSISSMSEFLFGFHGIISRALSGNVGADNAVFEQGASAGNVGQQKLVEQKKANPVALLLSSAMMLRHLQFPSFADRLETAVKSVISEGKCRTKDLGGDSTTQEVVDAVIAALD